MNFISPRKSLVLALGLLSATSATFADTLQVRQGLWVSSTIITLNGQPMEMPDMGGGAAGQEWQRMQQVAKQLGLPPSGMVSFNCERKGVYDLREELAKQNKDATCKIDLLDQRRDGARFAMHCQSPQYGASEGKGEATVLNGTEARYAMTGHAVVMGKPMNTEIKSVDKWIGADCAHPPAGIDPSWVDRDTDKE
jgi:hypothetical protein